jgi:hypothetical protein
MKKVFEKVKDATEITKMGCLLFVFIILVRILGTPLSDIGADDSRE